MIVNDGASFTSVDDGSLTSIFCYDAMVHFNEEVITKYFLDTYRVLAVNGMALYHHSNNSTYNFEHFGMNPHARAYLPDGAFKTHAENAGLKIIKLTVISWGNVNNLECISLLQK